MPVQSGIATMTGVIGVPLFDSGLDTSTLSGVGNSQVFNFYSMDLMLNPQADLAFPNNVFHYGAYVCSVGGFSECSNNPSGSFLPTNSGPSRIDGINYMLDTNGDPSSQPDIWYKKQPSAPGVYPANLSVMRTKLGGQPIGEGIFPFCWDSLPCIGFFSVVSLSLTFNVFLPNGGPALTTFGGPEVAGHSSSELGFNMLTARLFKNTIPTQPGLIDTSILWPPNGSIPSWHMSLTSGRNGGGQFYTDLTLDNDILNTALHTGPVKFFSNGLAYIITMFTNGLGPTGTNWETVIIDPTWTTYTLVRWLPQDGASSAAVNSSGSSFGWQVQIDSQGIVWMNPGDAPTAHKLFYSFSPKMFQFPAPLPYPPSPIPLPCYSTCEVIPY